MARYLDPCLSAFLAVERLRVAIMLASVAMVAAVPDARAEDDSLPSSAVGPPPGPPPRARRPQTSGRRESALAAAAASPDAAVRFLQTIGFGDVAATCKDERVDLMTMSMMDAAELERVLKVSPRKRAVHLYDECVKLKRCLFSTGGIELPPWLPLVLSGPQPPSGLKARPAARRVSHSAPRQRHGSQNLQHLQSQRMRFLMSGMKPPDEAAAEQGGAGGSKSRKGSPRHARRRLPDVGAALEAEEAKERVLAFIEEREAAVASLRQLMPLPQGVVGRRRATRALLMADGALERARSSLAEGLDRCP